MFDSTDTYTTADQQQLQALVDKYGGDVRHMRRELASTRQRAYTAKGIDGKAAIWREYFTNHPKADESDREKVRELSSRLHTGNVKYADVATRATLDAARDAGYLTDKEHATKLRAEMQRTIQEGQRTARELLKHLADLSESEMFEATATDDDKRRAMEGFSVEAEWERTKADFKQLFDAASPARKGELKRDHPELYRAAFGK